MTRASAHDPIPPAPLPGFGGTFLHAVPEDPSRWGQRAWGGQHIDVPAGDETIAVTGLDAAQRDALAGRFGDRPAQPAGPFALRLWGAPAADFRPVPPVRPWEYTFDTRYRADHVDMAGLGFFARIRQDRPRADLWLAEGAADQFLAASENVLRLVTAYRVLARGGVMLHSSAPVHGGRALACAAVSGTGKSTLARLALAAPGWDVLSDDLNALLPGDGGYRLQGLPFTGDLPRERATAPAPLAAVVLLEQATTDVLEPVPAARALARLVRCAPNVNADPCRQQHLLDNLARVAAAVPAMRLGFTRGGTALDLLADYLRGTA